MVKNKMKIELLILVVLLVPVAFALVDCSKVYVVNFNYDNGLITYKDKVIKCGYAPDMRLQPNEGYTLEVLSIDNKPMYSFKFKVPLNLNFDLSDPMLKNLYGGMLVLNETDFALIFPYYDQAKSIVVYNPRMYPVLDVPLIEEKFIQKKSFWWIIILIVGVLSIGYMIYRHHKKRQLT